MWWPVIQIISNQKNENHKITNSSYYIKKKTNHHSKLWYYCSKIKRNNLIQDQKAAQANTVFFENFMFNKHEMLDNIKYWKHLQSNSSIQKNSENFNDYTGYNNLKWFCWCQFVMGKC